MVKALATIFAFTTAASVAANVFLYNRYSTSRPLLRVGSEAISKKEYYDHLEHKFGKQTLQNIALDKMVSQAAQKANIKVTDAQVEARLREIERRAPETLLTAKISPAKMEEYKTNLRKKILLEELCLKDVKVSEAEVAAFYKRNAQVFVLPHHASATVVVAKNEVDASTAATLLKQNMRPDIIAQQPRLAVVGDNRYSRDWRQLPGDAGSLLNKQMYGKKNGDVVMTRAGGMFFVARINTISGGGLPPLSASNKELVTRLARLSKAPSEATLLTRLYQNSNVQFEVSRYSNYFADVEALAKQGGKQVAVNR